MKLRFKKAAYYPHQWKFLTAKTKFKALVTGVGGGKTYTFIRETLKNHIDKIDPETGRSNGWIIYPTFALAEELFVGPFCELLDRLGIEYDYNIQKNVIKTVYGRIRVYQLQQPKRMVGANLTYIGFDEFDIESIKNCRMAYNKAIGRMRGCKDPVLYIVTTPEGFKVTYEIFVKKASKSKTLIQAKSSDNKSLEQGYLDTMKEEYDEKLLEAYFEGKFVNLQSGSVYYSFDRPKHVLGPKDTPIKFDPVLPIALTVDFNVDPMVWTLCQIRSKIDIRIIEEICKRNTNTWDMCAAVKEHFPIDKKLGYHDNDLIVYGDSAGTARDTRSLQTDYSIISQELKPHFRSLKYKVPLANPPVRGRVNAMNGRLAKDAVTVNISCKEYIADCEQVVYNEKGDIDKKNMDRTHSTDGVGYMIAWEFPIKIKRKQTEARTL